MFQSPLGLSLSRLQPLCASRVNGCHVLSESPLVRDATHQPGTVVVMLRKFRAAPRTVRRLLTVVWLELAILVSFQAWAFVGVYQRAMETLQSYDPFAGMAESAPLTGVEAFTSSLAFSMPAGCAATALYLAARLAPPYRSHSRMIALVSCYASLLLGGATVLGVFLGNREIEAGTIGTLASMLFVLPLIPLLHHKTVQAWTRPLPVPPPDIDPNS